MIPPPRRRGCCERGAGSDERLNPGQRPSKPGKTPVNQRQNLSIIPLSPANLGKYRLSSTVPLELYAQTATLYPQAVPRRRPILTDLTDLTDVPVYPPYAGMRARTHARTHAHGRLSGIVGKIGKIGKVGKDSHSARLVQRRILTVLPLAHFVMGIPNFSVSLTPNERWVGRLSSGRSRQ